MVAAAARWALELTVGGHAFSFAAIPGEFEDKACSRAVMTAAATASPSLLFGENFLGIDDLEPVAAANAAAAAAAAHYSIACHFVSKCFEGGKSRDFPFIGFTGGPMVFPGKLRWEEGPACRMVVTHLMCCGCIMSASAMVTCPSVIALIARWGGLRWLADVVHACVQCLMSAEESLKKLAPAPSRSVVSLSQFSPSSASSSSPPPSSSSHSHVTGLVERMRHRLRVIFDFLQGEAAVLHYRPELALQQLQHSAGALADVSTLHSAAARIIHDEARNDLKSGGWSNAQRHDEPEICADALLGSSLRSSSPLPVRSGCMTTVEIDEGQHNSAVVSLSSSTASAVAAPPLLLLRSYSRPKQVRSRYETSSLAFYFLTFAAA